MAAYAALVSVLQIIDQIQRHPRPPISLHKEQTESLTNVVTFLQEFLEGYNPYVCYTEEVDPLDNRIAEAAYAAEDVIESYIVDQIHARHNKAPGNISSIEFYEGLQKVIEDMDLIKMEAVQIKENQGTPIKKVGSVADAGSFRSTSTAPKVGMVGFEDVLYQMLDKVTGGKADLQIIPIVGMGGIGKTTLARNIFIHPRVVEHFDVRAWSTISQEYDVLEILKQVLDQVDDKDKENRKKLNEHDIGDQLYKFLYGKRYLIVMDDTWSIEAWDSVRRWFPDNDNGSRVVVTTRLSNLASQFNESNSLKMKFLDEGSSWNLFSKTVFGEEVFPIELEGIGKKIVEGCKGLPLSISVIGGLLSKTGRTRENWELVEENLNSNVNMEDNENCLQILYMSYNNLPIYLKPCFLYMGMFPEDEAMITILLFSLWIAEGFVKPFPGKCLEEVGAMYLEELIERNLILAEDHDICGNLMTVKIHDLLRDLSLKEAQKLKFGHELGKHSSMPDVTQRRIRGGLSKYPPPLLESIKSSTLVRSLFGTLPNSLSHSFRLLRVSHCENTCFDEEKSSVEHERIFAGQVNLRYFRVKFGIEILPSSVYLLWNLQTIILRQSDGDYIFEIWKMPQLRCVIVRGRLDGTYCFPNQSVTVSENMHMGMDGLVVMENMQMLVTVRNLSISEEVISIIPNIKMLNLYYDSSSPADVVKLEYDYRLNNLSRLQKLETLLLQYSPRTQQHAFMRHLVSFPYSLKDLTLVETKLYWEDMQTKIGSLPLLQALYLQSNACIGSEWETFEGQFSSLKVLYIDRCADLIYWKTDTTHFPRLEKLRFCFFTNLNEIPLSIGDIPSLRSIELYRCNDSTVDSARRIQEEQEAFGNEDLQITIR